MNTTNTSSRFGGRARFGLSARGHSTFADYFAQIAAARGHGSSARVQFDLAQTSWARTHGLEVDDGAYLGELRERGRTLGQLGERLAVCGQTRDMIADVLSRLIDRGFVVRVATVGERPTIEAAQLELAVAQGEFESVCSDRRPDPRFDRRMVDGPLRHAASRVAVARKFLASFAAPR